MTIASEIQDLQTNLAAAKNAVTAKGGTVGNTGLAGLANEIAGIPSGSSPSQPTPGNDYATITCFSCEPYIADVILADSTTAKVFLSESVIQNLAGGLDDTILLEAVGDYEPNSGQPYNFKFIWDNSTETFKITYVDDSSSTIEYWEGSDADVEAAGGFVDPSSFSADTEVAYILGWIRPNDTINHISVGHITTFQKLMNPIDVGSGGILFPGAFDATGHIPNFVELGWGDVTAIVAKELITSINFGTQASMTSLGDRTFSNMPFLNSIYNLPSSVTTIGNSVLNTCENFNSPLDLSSVTSIGEYFLRGSSSFNQNILLPNSLQSIGLGFMCDCRSMTSTVTCEAPASAASLSIETFGTYDSSAPCYTTGITLAGTYASDWKTRFPDRTAQPYRKTIVTLVPDEDSPS